MDTLSFDRKPDCVKSRARAAVATAQAVTQDLALSIEQFREIKRRNEALRLARLALKDEHSGNTAK